MDIHSIYRKDVKPFAASACAYRIADLAAIGCAATDSGFSIDVNDRLPSLFEAIHGLAMACIEQGEKAELDLERVTAELARLKDAA